MVDLQNIKWQRYYYFIESVLISLCVTLSINTYFNLAISSIFIFIAVILFSGMLMVFNMTSQKSLSFILGGLFVLLVILLTACFKINLLQAIQNAFQWLLDFHTSQAAYVFHYAFFIIVFISFITSISFYPLQYFKYAKFILMITLFIGLIICSISNVTLSRITLFLALSYNACVLTQLVFQLQESSRFRQYKNSSVFLLPFSILIALPVLLLPYSKKPLSWQFATNFVRGIVESTDNFFYDLGVRYGKTNNEFGINFNGFNSSDHMTLGGKLTNHNDVLLTVSADAPFKNPLYLKGSIYNIYTGSGWQKGQLPFIPNYNDYELDCYENLYSLYRSRLTSSDKILSPVTINLKYEDIRTRSLFFSNNTHKILQPKDPQKLYAEGPNLVFSKTQAGGLTYELGFTEVNMNHPIFTDYLRSLDQFHYNSSSPTLHPLNTSTFSKNTLFFQGLQSSGDMFKDHTPINYEIFNTQLENILSQRALLIHKSYTSLPETLPKRIDTLAHEITKSASTNYDKLKAIETYLKQFQYTKSPTDIPKDMDFVDHFLFETQEGYCTYFASAMVVLGRCLDIPMRYVEGFVVSPQTATAYNTSYKLKSKHLHAWPEAYIEGYGWLTFEPTPGYNTAYENSWITIKSTLPTSSTDSSPIASVPLEITSEETTAATLETKKPSHIILTLLLLLGIFILLFMLYIAYTALGYIRTLGKGTPNEKAKLLLIEILYLLQRLGYKKASSQSLLQYADTLSQNTLISQHNTFTEIINTYLSYRYGHHLVTEEELQLLYNYRQFLYAQTKGHFKTVKILVYKISFFINGYKA